MTTMYECMMLLCVIIKLPSLIALPPTRNNNQGLTSLVHFGPFFIFMDVIESHAADSPPLTLTFSTQHQRVLSRISTQTPWLRGGAKGLIKDTIAHLNSGRGRVAVPVRSIVMWVLSTLVNLFFPLLFVSVSRY